MSWIEFFFTFKISVTNEFIVCFDLSIYKSHRTSHKLILFIVNLCISLCEIVAFGCSVQCGTEIAPIDQHLFGIGAHSVTFLLLLPMNFLLQHMEYNSSEIIHIQLSWLIG